MLASSSLSCILAFLFPANFPRYHRFRVTLQLQLLSVHSFTQPSDQFEYKGTQNVCACVVFVGQVVFVSSARATDVMSPLPRRSVSEPDMNSRKASPIHIVSTESFASLLVISLGLIELSGCKSTQLLKQNSSFASVSSTFSQYRAESTSQGCPVDLLSLAFSTLLCHKGFK